MQKEILVVGNYGDIFGKYDITWIALNRTREAISG